MILVDVNLLVYALFTGSARHNVAREWLEATLSGTETVALPWFARMLRGARPRGIS